MFKILVLEDDKELNRTVCAFLNNSGYEAVGCLNVNEAYDYMVKPINLDELFLRIGALLRRAKIASSRKLEIGSFVMDADEHTAYLRAVDVYMTKLRQKLSDCEDFEIKTVHGLGYKAVIK